MLLWSSHVKKAYGSVPSARMGHCPLWTFSKLESSPWGSLEDISRVFIKSLNQQWRSIQASPLSPPATLWVGSAEPLAGTVYFCPCISRKECQFYLSSHLDAIPCQESSQGPPVYRPWVSDLEEEALRKMGWRMWVPECALCMCSVLSWFQIRAPESSILRPFLLMELPLHFPRCSERQPHKNKGFFVCVGFFVCLVFGFWFFWRYCLAGQ